MRHISGDVSYLLSAEMNYRYSFQQFSLVNAEVEWTEPDAATSRRLASRLCRDKANVFAVGVAWTNDK